MILAMVMIVIKRIHNFSPHHSLKIFIKNIGGDVGVNIIFDVFNTAAEMVKLTQISIQNHKRKAFEKHKGKSNIFSAFMGLLNNTISNITEVVFHPITLALGFLFHLSVKQILLAPLVNKIKRTSFVDALFFFSNIKPCRLHIRGKQT